MNDLLEAKNLHKVYNYGKEKLHVLKGINLKLEKGEFLAILGPSGAGKSTLLHLLGALDSPTEGEIIFEGENLKELSDEKLSFIRNRRMGFVFQFYHLLSEFNVLENVMFPALITQKTKDKEPNPKDRALELLEIFGLKERVGHFPNELSGGEQQRVAIVRCLMNKPDILFCDEPTGNLDSENSKIFLNLLKRLNEENKITILIVTHNLEVAQFAKRILYMRDGLIYSGLSAT
jgi:ABC-type lipoprotein export system ATPase subunit